MSKALVDDALRGARANVEMWSEAANYLGRRLGEMRTERDNLRAFVRELVGDGGPLGVWREASNQCRRCGRSWSKEAPESHFGWCERPRALALLGDQDGERERVEGGSK